MSQRTARCTHGWLWFAACPECTWLEREAVRKWKGESPIFHSVRMLIEKATSELMTAPNVPQPGDGTWTGFEPSPRIGAEIVFSGEELSSPESSPTGARTGMISRSTRPVQSSTPATAIQARERTKMTSPKFEHDIDRWVRELTEAGWKPKTSTIWSSPEGKLYLGPFGAWKQMRQETDADAIDINVPAPGRGRNFRPDWLETDRPDVVACMGSVLACQENGCQARKMILRSDLKALIEKWTDRGSGLPIGLRYDLNALLDGELWERT